jgi:hypothetical protein
MAMGCIGSGEAARALIAPGRRTAGMREAAVTRQQRPGGPALSSFPDGAAAKADPILPVTGRTPA